MLCVYKVYVYIIKEFEIHNYRRCGLSPTNARCLLSHCVTFMYMSATYILLKMVFIPRGEVLDYRCVHAVMNVICVKTGWDWQNLRFKMERIRKKKKNNMTMRM